MLKAPTKITLKNTTKMTLNARFTNIMKSRPQTNPQTVKAQVSTEKLASERNRRLALQMENRHSAHVSTAAVISPPEPSRPSVRDRLGAAKGSVASRLRGGQSSRGRGVLRGAAKRGGIQRQSASARGRYFQSKRGGRGGSKQSVRGGFKKRGSFRGKRGSGERGGSIDKSKLDNDLESYMSKTKGGMDAELEAYMVDAVTN